MLANFERWSGVRHGPIDSWAQLVLGSGPGPHSAAGGLAQRPAHNSVTCRLNGGGPVRAHRSGSTNLLIMPMAIGFYDYGTQRSPIMNEAQRAIYDQLMPEPEPTFEERRQRCADLGLVICSCRGVETERGHRLIYDVNCPVHHGERRR